jgi:hypothetical protein
MAGSGRTLTVAAAVLIAATGCTSASSGGAHPTPHANPTLTGSTPAAVPAAHCAGRGTGADNGMPEIRGVSVSHATLWGLVFARYPVEPGKETKIVWRMTGTGPLSIGAVGPAGQRLRPAWGPEFHTGSSWHKPGEEWGTAFRFPVAGCWTIHASRGSSSAVAGVLVS